MKKLYAIAAALIICITVFSYDYDVPSNIVSIDYSDGYTIRIGWPIRVEQINDDYFAVHLIEAEQKDRYVEKIGLIHRLNLTFWISQNATKNRHEVIEMTKMTEFYSAEDIVENITETFGENILNEKYVYSPTNRHAPAYVITIKEHSTTE